MTGFDDLHPARGDVFDPYQREIRRLACAKRLAHERIAERIDRKPRVRDLVDLELLRHATGQTQGGEWLMNVIECRRASGTER